MFFERTASVQRLTPVIADTDKEQYENVGNYENIQINIQPASAELTAITEGAYGQTFQAFVSVSGINLGDRITPSGTSDYYIVKGKSDWNYLPIPHLELVLFKGDE